jgi:hypothetical protein
MQAATMSGEVWKSSMIQVAPSSLIQQLKATGFQPAWFKM